MWPPDETQQSIILFMIQALNISAGVSATNIAILYGKRVSSAELRCCSSANLIEIRTRSKFIPTYAHNAHSFTHNTPLLSFHQGGGWDSLIRYLFLGYFRLRSVGNRQHHKEPKKDNKIF